MAKRVKKLLKKMQETGQQVYGTRRTPIRTGLRVAVDAATGGKELKTNLALRAAQAAKKKAADLAAKRKVNKALKKAKEFDLSDLKSQAKTNKTKNQELIDIVDQMYEQAKKDAQKDKPPSADTRRMLEESTEDKINRANEEGVQESKTLPKTPATPAGRSKPSSQGGPRMGSTAKAGAAAERGALAGRRRKGKVTVEEVQKRAKGGMVKKKTSARKKPRGVGAATRGYGRALR